MTIAEVQFDNQAATAETYQENEDSCRHINDFNENQTLFNFSEDQDINSEIFSVKENQNTEAFENNEDIEDTVQPIKKEIQIYGNSTLIGLLNQFRIIF